VPQRVFQHPLLDRRLRRHVQMLHAAAAAFAEVAQRGSTRCGLVRTMRVIWASS
jgi:hypothetical protein